jgi:uncharacterized protein YggT (Ycf19 family)
VAEAFSIWVIILDYLLGMVMYTLIGRFAMGLFLPEDSTFFFMKAFVKLTDPVIKLFKWITPSFLIQPFVPLYVAWFFFMFRFYPFLPDALAARLLGDGHVVIPAGKRAGARRRQPGRLLRRLASVHSFAVGGVERPAVGFSQASWG